MSLYNRGSEWYRPDATPSYRYRFLNALSNKKLLSEQDQKAFDSIDPYEDEFSSEDKALLRSLYERQFESEEKTGQYGK